MMCVDLFFKCVQRAYLELLGWCGMVVAQLHMTGRHPACLYLFVYVYMYL